MYIGQISVLLTKLREISDAGEAGGEAWAADMKKVSANTVHSYQGRESDIVLFDTVSATEAYGNLFCAAKINSGHVRDPNRLNVALTRARYGCAVFGEGALLWHL